LSDGTVISPKYVGQQRLVEIAVATLATDRALLLLGVPGTAKTWVSEHLAAAISGDSTLLVQGTAGTTEETLRYGWNYARLLAEGPSTAALVPGPIYRGMERGAIVRVEELTRMPPEVQDALVTVLSEKVLPVPELDTEIARSAGSTSSPRPTTATGRQRPLQRAAPALQHRRAPAAGHDRRGDRHRQPSRRRTRRGAGPARRARRRRRDPSCGHRVPRAAIGLTEDERTSVKIPTGTLSTAEAISVVTNGIALAAHFGDGELRSTDVAAGIVGAVVSDPVHDASHGASTSKPSCANAPVGTTSTRPVASSTRDCAREHVVVTVHLLGIRHHGPGSARSVLRALDELRPDIVLVEVPADVDAALRWVGEPGLVPPVALLTYVPAEPGRAAFAPFATFSPEWQAIGWANRHGIEVHAIDLPLAVTLAAVGDDDAASLVAQAAPPDPMRELAAAAGDPDPERWWEDVIEHRGDGAPAFDAVADAMVRCEGGIRAHTARAATRSPHAPCDPGRPTRRPWPIVVVCGAWHVPALDLDAPGTPNVSHRRPPPCAGLPKVKTAVAWVPWTHRRLAADSGYAAGVDSPGWYRHVFDHPGSDGVARFFVDAARLVRERGGAASPDHLIAGTRLAESLAAMRGRPRVGLAEVLDAADAVMGGLDLVRRELVVGDEIGAVPPSAPQVPLARDLGKAQKSARLAPRAETAVVEIDLRTPVGLRKSHLLHRLVALDVPWGAVVDGRGSSGTFRETWELRWDPELSVRLIERAGYGTTLESAATARLLERAAVSSGIVELVGIVTAALFADLPRAVEPAVQRLASRAATDPDVGRLLDALPALAGALRYGDVRSTDAGALREVVDGIVIRILAGVVASARSLDDDGAAVLVERLTGLQGALAVLDHPARRHGLPIVLVDLATGSGHGLVQGRATRLLHDAGVWSVDAVQRRLSQALSAGTPPAVGAAFVEGFLAGSGSVLIHDADLLAVLDGWLSSLRPESFDSVVALLRRTFGAFEAAERRQLMRLLMGIGVERADGFGADVDPARAAGALTTVRHMLGVGAS
jgi:hypothetical protein